MLTRRGFAACALEGASELRVDGQGTRTFNVGDGFQVPTRPPHSGKGGDKPRTFAITYIVEKGNPLASPLLKLGELGNQFPTSFRSPRPRR